jgi:hypothetical protein
MSYLYLVLFILVIYLIYGFYENKKIQIENFTNYMSSCGTYPKLLEKVMKERNMEPNKNYDIYMPCSYNTCEKDVLAFENKETGKKLFFIDGCDWIASKLGLWELLKEYYKDNASDYMPTTHLLENKKDIIAFDKHFENNKLKRPNHMYVLKNYAQRQEGIKLTRDKTEILNGLKNGWYLVQDYMYNPFLIDNRKINFRYYMLVVCYNSTIEAYVHKDGFVYYTPEYYDENDIDFKKHITTGYIDRKVYEKNPLTLQDFRNHLDRLNPGSSKVWDTNANNLLNKVMEAISKKICKNKKLDKHVRFQLFGCDLAPDANLGVKLMEINKGPDLGAKDERDKQVKIQVQKDIFKIIDPMEGDTNNRFIKIF